MSEKAALRTLVKDFSAEMREKLLAKADQGWVGWDHPNYRLDLEQKLFAHVLRALRGDSRQWVDVANFAAFLWAQSSEGSSS